MGIRRFEFLGEAEQRILRKKKNLVRKVLANMTDKKSFWKVLTYYFLVVRGWVYLDLYFFKTFVLVYGDCVYLVNWLNQATEYYRFRK